MPPVKSRADLEPPAFPTGSPSALPRISRRLQIPLALPNGFPAALGRRLHPNCVPHALPSGFPLAFKFPSRLREGYRSRTSGCHRQFARAASQLCLVQPLTRPAAASQPCPLPSPKPLPRNTLPNAKKRFYETNRNPPHRRRSGTLAPPEPQATMQPCSPQHPHPANARAAPQTAGAFLRTWHETDSNGPARRAETFVPDLVLFCECLNVRASMYPHPSCPVSQLHQAADEP